MRQQSEESGEGMPSILIVDDNKINLQLLCGMLAGMSWRVRPVASGIMALKAAMAKLPDLILLDAMMPGMDGFEVCRHLKQTPATEHIPIVMITALTDQESRMKALRCGADDFLSKPVDRSELQVRTQNLLRVKKYGDLLREYNEALTKEVMERTQELQGAYETLTSTQSQLLRQEKLASMGVLMAGIAHEINNPVGFISSNLQTLNKYVERMTEFIQAQDGALKESGCPGETADSLARLRRRLKLDHILLDSPSLLQESLDGAQRVRKIVQDMKLFSHANDDVPRSTDINLCLESTLNLLRNELKYKTTLRCEYGELPAVLCLPDQLNQVFMNLLVNAVHAIEVHGEVTVRSWRDGERVCVAISDTGCGIPADLRERIFEPFFTTKGPGKGTGLGLSISYDIVRNHGGEISVESEMGKGTTFIVAIPVNPSQPPLPLREGGGSNPPHPPGLDPQEGS